MFVFVDLTIASFVNLCLTVTSATTVSIHSLPFMVECVRQSLTNNVRHTNTLIPNNRLSFIKSFRTDAVIDLLRPVSLCVKLFGVVAIVQATG